MTVEAYRAQQAFRQGGDTRRLKVELRAGNRFALAKLARLGLTWQGGMIVGVADLEAARAACQAARWVEQHRDDCLWCRVAPPVGNPR